jgi:hypothetical protein
VGPEELSGSPDLRHRASVGRASPVPPRLSRRGRCPKEGRGRRMRAWRKTAETTFCVSRPEPRNRCLREDLGAPIQIWVL